MKRRRRRSSLSRVLSFSQKASLLLVAVAMNVGGIFLLAEARNGNYEVEVKLTPRNYLIEKCSAMEDCDFTLLDTIITCESSWRMVKNSGSSAFGYFQIIDATERGTPQFKEGKRKFDPYTNIDMGLYLYDRYGARPWSESKGCWYWKHQRAQAAAAREEAPH